MLREAGPVLGGLLGDVGVDDAREARERPRATRGTARTEWGASHGSRARRSTAARTVVRDRGPRTAAGRRAAARPGRRARRRPAAGGSGSRPSPRRRSPAGRARRGSAYGVPSGGVVQVVELADRGDPGLRHLEEREGRDRLDRLRVEGVRDRVHPVAPAPEVVPPGRRATGRAPGSRAGTRGECTFTNPGSTSRPAGHRHLGVAIGRHHAYNGGCVHLDAPIAFEALRGPARDPGPRPVARGRSRRLLELARPDVPLAERASTPTASTRSRALAFLEMARGRDHHGRRVPLPAPRRPTARPTPTRDELAQRVIAAAGRSASGFRLLRVAYARAGAGRAAARRPAPVRGPRSRTTSSPRSTRPLGAVGSPRTRSARCRPGALRALSGFAGVVHAHVTSSPPRTSLRRRARVLPAAALRRAGLLTERFTAVHLTHPMDGDVALAWARGASVCVLPVDRARSRRRVPAGRRARSGADLRRLRQPRGDRSARRGARARAACARVAGGGTCCAGGRRTASRSGSCGRERRRGDRILGGAGRGSPRARRRTSSLDLDRAAADGVPPLEAAAFVATPGVGRRGVGRRPTVVAGGRTPVGARSARGPPATCPGLTADRSVSSSAAGPPPPRC